MVLGVSLCDKCALWRVSVYGVECGCEVWVVHGEVLCEVCVLCVLRRISCTQEAEVAVSQDHTTVLQLR